MGYESISGIVAFFLQVSFIIHIFNKFDVHTMSKNYSQSYKLLTSKFNDTWECFGHEAVFCQIGLVTCLGVHIDHSITTTVSSLIVLFAFFANLPLKFCLFSSVHAYWIYALCQTGPEHSNTWSLTRRCRLMLMERDRECNASDPELHIMQMAFRMCIHWHHCCFCCRTLEKAGPHAVA
jgi:hypothetical protein